MLRYHSQSTALFHTILATYIKMFAKYSDREWQRTSLKVYSKQILRNWDQTHRYNTAVFILKAKKF